MRIVLASLTLAVTLLAACGDSAPPATSTPTITASPTPTPTSPARIEASATPTIEAARATTTPTPTLTPTATPSATPTTTPTPTPRPSTPPPGVRLTEIRRSTFESPIEVVAGTTVTWRNEEGVAHTVSAVDGSFDSPFFGADGQFSHRFLKPGQVELFCRVHAGMTGVVIVR